MLDPILEVSVNVSVNFNGFCDISPCKPTPYLPEKPFFSPFIFGMMRQPVCHTAPMSIDRSNQLRFPASPGPVARSAEPASAKATGSATVADSNTSDGKTASAKAGAPRLTARVPTLSERIEPALVSVVVHIQSDAQTRVAAVEPVVYGNTRKAAAPANKEADLAEMEAAHQRAQERSANAVTALTAGAEGIVVARQPDFVSVAVSAMRDFRDEGERQKRYAEMSLASAVAPTAPEAATPARTPAGAFHGLQQLASRLNLFA